MEFGLFAFSREFSLSLTLDKKDKNEDFIDL